ncbi:MAG: metalloprotease family protein [Ignisphaera sp.]|nr:metalloprotease family protein [Ignisphaera sp.]MCC6056231.1 metalloprotease family protein [Desulfurococcaceae archaeon]
MKVKPAAYILLGFTIAWLLTKLLNWIEGVLVIGLIPFIGFAHELLHLISSLIVGASHKFTFNGLLIGFKIVSKSVEDFIAIALSPQIISILLLILYAILSSSIALALAVIHIAISVEDLSKITKYLLQHIIN